VQRVTQVLDSKGVLTRLKVRLKDSYHAGYKSLVSRLAMADALPSLLQAELRANVFLAINDQDIQNGGVGEFTTVSSCLKANASTASCFLWPRERQPHC
jgi:hypothetical protein